MYHQSLKCSLQLVKRIIELNAEVMIYMWPCCSVQFKNENVNNYFILNCKYYNLHDQLENEIFILTFPVAFDERIAFRQIFWTSTYWIMTDNMTSGVQSTAIHTRIFAFEADTSFITRAIRAYRTLWTTCRGCAKVSSSTRANGTIARHMTLAVWTTCRRIAGIPRIR